MNLTKKTITNMNNIRKLCSGLVTQTITIVEKTIVATEKKIQKAHDDIQKNQKKLSK